MKRVAVVEANYGFFELLRDTTLRDFSLRHIDHALPALDQLMQTRCDGIMMQVKIAAGYYEGMHVPEEVRRIMELDRPECYYEMGLHVVRKLKSPESANKETPIIVHGLYKPEGDRVFENAERRILEAGAAAYVMTDSSVFEDRSPYRETVTRLFGR